MVDILIVGGGVCGALAARESVRRGMTVAVLERGSDVCMGASRANSGIVHAGHDAPAGSNKAKFNVAGNRMMQRVCAELGVKFRNNGSLVCAMTRDDVPTLTVLYERGVQNGVQGLEILTPEQVREREPALKETFGALYAPTGGIVCPYGLTIAAMGNAMDNGAELLLNFEVKRIERLTDGYRAVSADGQTAEGRLVMNCAGIGAQKIANLMGDTSFVIGARKGEYILLDRTCGGTVYHTVFTCPTKAGKGVLVTPTVDGNLLLGPTSEEIADGEDTSTQAKGMRFVREKASEMLQNVPLGETITSFAGVRAYCDKGDFVVGFSGVCPDLIHAAGIESPGLTSAPAIAEHVAELAAQRLHAAPKADFQPIRKSESWFRSLSEEDKNKAIAKDPDFGRIICRCESVTLGEILEAVKANPPATTLDGIKLRTRAGMGRCQSGFCQPSVWEVLRDRLGIPGERVQKGEPGSHVIVGRTK